MKAISAMNDISIVDLKKCIGCGLCVTGCPVKVKGLERKAEEMIVNPPKKITEWEHERLVNRGLA